MHTLLYIPLIDFSYAGSTTVQLNICSTIIMQFIYQDRGHNLLSIIPGNYY
jgi:hypothetical protein